MRDTQRHNGMLLAGTVIATMLLLLATPFLMLCGVLYAWREWAKRLARLSWRGAPHA